MLPSVKPKAIVDFMPSWAKFLNKPFVVSMGALEVAYADRKSAELAALKLNALLAGEVAGDDSPSQPAADITPTMYDLDLPS